MRYKGLSVCLIALLVFFGLRSVMKRVEPRAAGHPALLESSPRPLGSRNHLASLASLAAGALAFAVIPGRPRQSAPRRTATKRPAPATAAAEATPEAAAAIPEHIVRCPLCERAMNRVVVNSGEHRGRAVWLCPQSPDCEVRPLTRRRRPIFVPHAS